MGSFITYSEQHFTDTSFVVLNFHFINSEHSIFRMHQWNSSAKCMLCAGLTHFSYNIRYTSAHWNTLNRFVAHKVFKRVQKVSPNWFETVMERQTLFLWESLRIKIVISNSPLRIKCSALNFIPFIICRLYEISHFEWNFTCWFPITTCRKHHVTS